MKILFQEEVYSEKEVIFIDDYRLHFLCIYRMRRKRQY